MIQSDPLQRAQAASFVSLRLVLLPDHLMSRYNKIRRWDETITVSVRRQIGTHAEYIALNAPEPAGRTAGDKHGKLHVQKISHLHIFSLQTFANS